MNRNGKFILFTIGLNHSLSTKEIEHIVLPVTQAQKKFLIFFHPKIKSQISKDILDKIQIANNVYIAENYSYLTQLYLIKDNRCEMVITTSNNFQLETFLLQKPCIIIDRSTFWPEPLEHGTSFLVRADPKEIQKKVENIENNDNLRKIFQYINSQNPYGDTAAAKRIINVIQKYKQNLHFSPEEFYKYGSRTFLLIFVKNPMPKEEIEKKYNCTITLVYDDAGAPIPIPKTLYPGYRVRVILK